MKESKTSKFFLWGIEYKDGTMAKELWHSKRQASKTLWTVRTFQRANDMELSKGKIVKMWVIPRDK